MSDLAATDRVARVVEALCQGECLTVKQVAGMCEMSFSGARYLLIRVSRVMNVYEDQGVWRKLTNSF